jgi:GT2 family glycosyltransferase
MSTCNPSLRVTVVIVADGPWDDTFRCLQALAVGSAGVDHEIIVVDDATGDETAAALPRMPGITAVRTDEPRGFAACAAAGAGLARAPLLAFLHADAEPRPDWLATLAALAEGDEHVAVVASRLVTPGGCVESDGMVFAYASPYPMTPVAVGAGDPVEPGGRVTEVTAAQAVALLVRRASFEAVGGFDATLSSPAADLDLCLKLRTAGGTVLIASESVVVHHARCSGEISDEEMTLLTRRWLGRIPLHDGQGYREAGPPPARSNRPSLSVVVPVHNALQTIAPCLEQVLRNLGPQDEVIAADAGSSDGTPEYLARMAHEHGARLRAIDSGVAGGLAQAVRAGFDAARHPLALLVPAAAGAPVGFVDEVTRLVEGHGAPRVATVLLPPAGQCAVGPAALFRAISVGSAGVFLEADPTALASAVVACGATIGIVEPAPHVEGPAA